MREKLIKILILITVELTIVLSLVACTRKVYLTVTYFTTKGGSIVGESEQQVVMGEDAKEVTAVADEGYIFVKWSDGNLSAKRTEKNINQYMKRYFTAIFEQLQCGVKYEAGIGGIIEGETNQTIGYGNNASSVAAKPNEGYIFIGWSDGNVNAERTDESIKADFNVTAQFERIAGTFIYNYNNATASNVTENIHLKRGELKGTQFVIPQKEHFTFNGWYLDENFNTPVADETGKVLIGDEIFDNHTSDLYAKWTVIEKITYKILLIFDTEVKADLETVDGKIVKVDYKMSALERKFCQAIITQFDTYLNRMLDGLITFEIDSYFTTVPLGKDNIQCNSQANQTAYSIDARDIPEVSGMLDDYRSVINTFSFDDYEQLLMYSSGSGGEKFAEIHFENLIGRTLANGGSLETLLDLSYKDWKSIMGTYAHEFTHTLEQGISNYSYHHVLAEYQRQGIYDLDCTTIYLLNQAIVSDETEKVGIPYSFWKNEIYTVRYENNSGGNIGSDWTSSWHSIMVKIQYVPKGSRTRVVIAESFPGYRFVGWSDGVTTAMRTDYNIQSDFTVTALFEKAAYEVIYNAGVGGSIIGKTEQLVKYYEKSETVIAVADEGYRFVGWSDGYVQANRYDYIYDKQAQNNGLNVTALFERIEI